MPADESADIVARLADAGVIVRDLPGRGLARAFAAISHICFVHFNTQALERSDADPENLLNTNILRIFFGVRRD